MIFSSGFLIFIVYFISCISAIDYAKMLDQFIEKIEPSSIKDPEEQMTVDQIIQYHGYPVEIYNVTTEDGYILVLHNIPYGKRNNDTSDKRKPVLILHGILCNSGVWIVNTPDKNLPYILADRGYDVWLGNFRGNNISRFHVTLNENQDEYWKFSFDEMAMYDLPTMIDFILVKTGFNQLHYIGHSMGNTAMFALLSTKTEYNEKIRSFHALAPVARLDHVKSPIILFVMPYAEQLVDFIDNLGTGVFLPRSSSSDLFAASLCRWITKNVCSNALFLTSGFDSILFNASRMPVFFRFFPSGTSSQVFHHYAQIAKQHRFQAHDFGEDINMKKYNQPFPPIYDVTKITAPTSLYWSDSDWIATPKDVAYLVKKLQKNLILNYRIPFVEFNHIDFVWATESVSLVYSILFEKMESL